MNKNLTAVAKLLSVSSPLQNTVLQRLGYFAYRVLKLNFINRSREGWTMLSEANRQRKFVFLNQLCHLI